MLSESRAFTARTPPQLYFKREVKPIFPHFYPRETFIIISCLASVNDEYDDDESIIEKNDDDEVLLDDDFGGFNAFKSNERATKRRGKTNDDG